MGFVKDRHDETGQILDEPEVRRAGRIVLGRKKEGGGAENLPYFQFKVYEREELVGEALLTQVKAALEQYAPGQNLDQPTVLPVFLPADNIDLIANSIYKLAGQDGRPRCIGDGETIQFKTGTKVLLEVHSGRVVANRVAVDKNVYQRGDEIFCPGRSFENRWGHCEKCRLSFTTDLQLAGLPYIWSLTTGDQDFYTQFFTLLELMRGHIKREDVHFMTEIPLLLRKEERTKARPQTSNAGTELRFQDMNLLSIEIHPVWLMQMGMKRSKVLVTGEVPRIEAPKEEEPPSLYDESIGDLPERPWEPLNVGMFVTQVITKYNRKYEDGEEMASDTIREAVSGMFKKLLAKNMEAGQGKKAIGDLFWYLFDDTTLTQARAVALWIWGRDDSDSDSKPWSTFEQEFLDTIGEAGKMRALADKKKVDEEKVKADEEMAKIGAKPVEFQQEPLIE